MSSSNDNKHDLLADFLRQRFEVSPLGRNLPWDAQSDRVKARWRLHASHTAIVASVQSEPPDTVPRGVLAEAMRGLNMRAHADTGWDSVTDSGKKMWLDRARQLQEEIDKATARRAS